MSAIGRPLTGRFKLFLFVVFIFSVTLTIVLLVQLKRPPPPPDLLTYCHIEQVVSTVPGFGSLYRMGEQVVCYKTTIQFVSADPESLLRERRLCALSFRLVNGKLVSPENEVICYDDSYLMSPIVGPSLESFFLADPKSAVAWIDNLLRTQR